ncbi:MAG: AbrB/MazE/SpoVT family DNA-binding domain-containing protein [Legionella sp.]|nr:AbrB/MazE/SpoVT family DNA-binding domain-containing protein [Legionella sp.]
MLKKLVKYGNSKALVLDRAILELLNIKEGALVKLRTDGKSLTITPVESLETEDLLNASL